MQGGVSADYYDDTIICYSYSKSLSLPGERIGYILVSPRAGSRADLFAGDLRGRTESRLCLRTESFAARGGGESGRVCEF